MAGGVKEVGIRLKVGSENTAAVDKLGKQLRELGVDTEALDKKAGELSQELQKLGREETLVANFVKQKKATEDAAKALADAQKEAQRLGKEMGGIAEPTKKQTAALEKARTAVRGAKEAYVEQANTLQATRKSLADAGISTDNLAGAQVRVRKQLTETQAAFAALTTQAAQDIQATRDRLAADQASAQGMQAQADAAAKAKQSLGDMKLELAAAGAAAYTIGRALGGAAKEASAFESNMAEVATLVDDTSGLTAQAEAVRALAREYGGNAADQAKALYQIISAGAKEGAEATGVLEQANKLAVGGVTEIKTAADGLTSVMNAYGKEAGTVAEVSDAFFVAMRAGKTTVGELSASIGQVAPISAQAGVGLTELLSATAALTKGGTSTSESMTQVRGIISAIIKPTTEAADVASELGIQFDAQALKAKGLAGFLADVREKTGGNTETMAKLFGSVEALAGVLSLTGNQAEDFGAILQAMEQRAGATDVAVSKIAQTSGFAAKRFDAALADVRISAGQSLTALTPLLEVITDALDLFNDLPSGVKTTVAGLGALAVAAAPAALAIGSITKAVGLATTALGLHATVARALPAALAPAVVATAAIGPAAAATVAPMGAAAAGMGLLTRAALGLRAAVGVLLGPVGLAVTAVAALVPEFLRAKQAAEDGDEAVRKMLQGPPDGQLSAKARDGAEAVSELARAAQAAEAELKSQTDAALRAAKALDVDVAQASDKVTAAFSTNLRELDKLVAGLGGLKARGVDTGAVVGQALAKMIDGAKTRREVDAVVDRVNDLGKRGVISAEAVAGAFDKAGAKVRSLAEQAEDATPGVQSLGEAARKAGVDLAALTGDLSPKARDSLRAVADLTDEILRAGIAAGRASPVLGDALDKRVQAATTTQEVDELRKEIERARDAGVLFGRDLEKALAAAAKKANELSPAFRQAAADAERLGIKLTESSQKSAESGIVAYERLKASGKATAADLDKAFANLANEQIAASTAAYAAADGSIRHAAGVVPEWVRVEAQFRKVQLVSDEFGTTTVRVLGEGGRAAKGLADTLPKIGEGARTASGGVDTLRKSFDGLANSAKTAGEAQRTALQASGGGGFGLASGDAIAQRNARVDQDLPDFKSQAPSGGGTIFTPPPDSSGDWKWVPMLGRNRQGGEWQLTDAAALRRQEEQQAGLGLVKDQYGIWRQPGQPGQVNGASGVAPFGGASTNPSNVVPVAPVSAAPAGQDDVLRQEMLRLQVAINEFRGKLGYGPTLDPTQTPEMQRASVMQELVRVLSQGAGRQTATPQPERSTAQVVEFRFTRPEGGFIAGTLPSQADADALARLLRDAFERRGAGIAP